MGLLKPNQVLNKAYRQVAIETTDFDLFKNALRTLRDNIVDGQREHTQKEHLRNFLSETFYKPYYMAPEEDIDLAIRLDKTIKSNIGLLIEVKSTTNKGEMISNDNLNRKALQELLLYYLKERVNKKNNDIKYLIATNIHEFFIFDAHGLNANSIRTNNYVVSFKTLWMDAKPVTKPISSILKLQQPILRR